MSFAAPGGLLLPMGTHQKCNGSGHPHPVALMVCWRPLFIFLARKDWLEVGYIMFQIIIDLQRAHLMLLAHFKVKQYLPTTLLRTI